MNKSNNPVILFLKSIFTTLFGQVTWRAPVWYTQLRDYSNQCPKRFLFFSLSIILIISGVVLAGEWLHLRPRPPLITAQITLPLPTKLEKSAKPEVLSLDFGIGKESFAPYAVAPIEKIGKNLKEGVSITPEIKGVWTWDNDSHLVFTPEEEWLAGQAYRIHFTKTFFAKNSKMASYDYTFTTNPFALSLIDFSLYQDPTNADIRQATATVSFNYPVDPESFENNIALIEQALKNDTVDLKAKRFRLKVTYDEFFRTAYLHSDTIPIEAVERYLDLSINKGVKTQKGPSKTQDSLTKNLLVPDFSTYFKVAHVSANIVRNPQDKLEQVLTVETSIGVQEAEMNKNLHVYLLPAEYPATATEPSKENYAWQNPGEVSPAILALSTAIDLQSIPADRDYATLHHFVIKTKTPRYLYLKLNKGMTGLGGFQLQKDYEAVIKVPDYPKEIGFLHHGALLALTGEKKLSVIVRGVPAVKFDIARVLPNQVNQLITQTNGDFNNPRFINPSFDQNNISQLFSDIQTFDSADPANAQYTALDLGKYLNQNSHSDGPKGLFLLKATGWDPDNKIPLDVNSSRLILMTDLGLIVKDNGDNSHDVYVQSISTGAPVAKAAVSILGKNGLPILTHETDATGHVNFPSLKDYTDDREPTVYLAELGNDIAFIPFSHFDRQLNFSRYDIGGVYSSQDAQSLNAYVFSDRGIYRPGDTVHIGMIVKQAYANPSPAGLPLEASVVDPRGAIIKSQKLTLDALGLLSLDFATDPASPTGTYTVNLFIVKDHHPSNLLGSTSVRVAEFLPDTMRITSHLSSEPTTGWVSPIGLTADVGLWNLYGMAATHRKMGAKILLTPQSLQFNAFPGYTFVDPLLDPKKPPKVFTDTLNETQTNDQGHAEFDLNLDRFEKATYQLTFFAEGFDAAGGRSVTTKTSILVSPLSYLIGYKPDGDLNYIKQNAVRTVDFVAINSQLKQEAQAGLKIRLLSLHPVSTLVKKPNGTYQYQSIMQTSVVNTIPFAISATGANYILPTDKIGDFAISLLDKDNVEISRFSFSVVGNSQQPLPKNAELNVKLNKAEYMPNEDIELQLTAPYTGAGLITIERDKVFAAQWFKTDKTRSVQKIHLPNDFQGNGYVNIAYVRDWNSPEIFISPLSYSVAPFSVNHANRALQVTLDTPTLARPGEPFTIHYHSDKPGKIIIFAVDEGILQAADYKTPDPLAFFFQKHALEVNTQQTLDQILPKFIQDRELSAVGGDTGEAKALKTLNPFKRKTELPVVYWSGIVDTDSTSRELTYQVPNYFNGALRIMAVAVTDTALGAASKTAEVRGDFVITPNAPTFVAPDDEFEITASVANNVAGSNTDTPISVKLQVSPQLEIRGDTVQNLKLAYGKEQSVHFTVHALDVLGAASITLTASGQGKSSQMTSTLSVRPLNPYLTSVMSGYAKSGTQSLNVDRLLYPQFRKVEASISSNPLILIVGLNRYLEKYPFGCTEQLTSEGMPLLALSNQPWFAKETSALTQQVQRIIQMLGERQMSSGGFSYWPSVAMNDNNPFASVYALHFLTEARAHGFDVPAEVLGSGMDYLKTLASQTVNNLDEARIQAYAIYVLTRNEFVTTNYLTNLQLYLDKDPAHAWHKDIISAYIASTYQLLKSSAEANRLMHYYRPNAPAMTSDFYDKNIANAQYLYLLAEHFPDQLRNAGDQIVLPLVDALNSGEMNTLLSGFTSLAFSAYAQSFQLPEDKALTITTIHSDGKKTSRQSENTYQTLTLDDSIKKVQFGSPSASGYYYQLTQAGYDKNSPQDSIKKGLEVFREYRDLQGQVINTPDLGSEVEVHITIRALGQETLTNIAIVDLLPGGFEVVPNSVNTSSIDYVDEREDRVIFFTSVDASSKDIVYRIKAVNAGQYAIPPIIASSMYNPAVLARSIGDGRITIGP